MGAKTPHSDEPEAGVRCPTPSRQEVSYGMVQTGPAAASTARASAQRVGAVVDPDTELIERWQAGDESAFEALIRRHERKVFGLALRMLGDREEAADVAQEAFLSLHRHGRRFRREARFSTFVYRVAANAALNRRRTLGRKRAREQALARQQQAGFDLPSSHRDPEDAASGGEIQKRVQQALLELPPGLRMAVVLYDIEGQSYSEIAEALRIPEGTVKSRIHRARSALRGLLRPLASTQIGGVEP